MLESRKDLNALLEKMTSFNFIFLTFKSKVRKPSVIEELLSETAVFLNGESDGEEIRVAVSGGVFIKKI